MVQEHQDQEALGPPGIATDPSGYVIAGGATSSFDFTNRSRSTATLFAVTSDSGANAERVPSAGEIRGLGDRQ